MNLNIIKKIIIAFAIMFLVSLPSMAETGNITLVDSKLLAYQEAPTGTNGAAVNWSKIKFDSTNYNIFDGFKANLGADSVFVHSYESTSFIIASGGIGTGFAWYDRNTTSVYYECIECLITNSVINLTLNKQIFSNVTVGVNGHTGASISSTRPVCLYSSDALCAFTSTGGYMPSYSNVRVSLEATDSYVVIYPSGNIFQISITKNPSVNTKYFIDSYSGVTHYSQETVFNKVDINNATFSYGNGISLNTTLSNGVYVRTYINSSGAAAPGTTGTVNFNKASYDIYDDFNISWDITNINTSKSYKWKLIKDATGTLEVFGNIYSESDYDVISNVVLDDRLTPQTYTIQLWECMGAICVELDESQVFYGASVAIPIGNNTLLNVSINQGQSIYMKYNLSTSGRITLIEDQTGYMYHYFVSAGNSVNFSIYVPENFGTGYNYINLYHPDIDGNYVLLDTDSFAVNPIGGSSIRFEKSIYSQGEIIRFFPYASVNGFTVLKDPSGIVKNNVTYTANQYLTVLYPSSVNDAVGTYTAYVYNNAGVLLNSTTAYVNFGMQTAVPTVAGTATSTPVTLIDISSELSEGILGKLDANSDGLNSNEELSGFGNKILSTLILIVLVLLISGIFSRKR